MVFIILDDKEKLYRSNLSTSLEDFPFGSDFSTSNSRLESIFHSDSSLMEVEMPPTVQGEQRNADFQEKCILKHLQPVQEPNYSNIG